MLANKIEDNEITKTAHKLYVMHDEKGNRMASLTHQGVLTFFKTFGLERHADLLDVIREGETAGFWLGDGVQIENRQVTAFTLTRETWDCYS